MKTDSDHHLERGEVRSGIYDNSEKSPLIQLINQARSRLDIEIYEMDDPHVIESIRNALHRGVQVHIVKEPVPVGASCRVFENGMNDSQSDMDDDTSPKFQPSSQASCATQRQLVTEVNESGGSYVPFAKPDLCGANGTKNCLEHGKLVIADSQTALISTGNFNTTSLCDLEASPRACNRDYSYITNEQEVVHTLQQVIENDLLGQRYELSSIIPTRMETKMTVRPNSLDPIITLIQSAKRQILIENQYLKDPTLNAALIKMAKKGVHVQITIASACSFGKPKETEAKKLSRIFKDFEQVGISIRMFTKNIRIRGEPGYLHAKAIIIDGQKAWVGSVNGSTQALTLNREFGIFFDDAPEVKKLVSIMKSDFSDPQTESWEESLNCAENRHLN